MLAASVARITCTQKNAPQNDDDIVKKREPGIFRKSGNWCARSHFSICTFKLKYHLWAIVLKPRRPPPTFMKKIRIDELLIKNGLAETQAAAAAMVMAGVVLA